MQPPPNAASNAARAQHAWASGSSGWQPPAAGEPATPSMASSPDRRRRAHVGQRDASARVMPRRVRPAAASTIASNRAHRVRCRGCRRCRAPYHLEVGRAACSARRGAASRCPPCRRPQPGQPSGTPPARRAEPRARTATREPLRRSAGRSFAEWTADRRGPPAAPPESSRTPREGADPRAGGAPAVAVVMTGNVSTSCRGHAGVGDQARLCERRATCGCMTSRIGTPATSRTGLRQP